MKTLLVCVALFLLSACSHDVTPEDARKQLGQMNIQYNEASFINAARDGDEVTVKLFLQAGMNPNARDSQERLAYTFLNSDDKLVYELAGKDNLRQALGKTSPNHATALMSAAVKGRASIVKLLLSHGADHTLKDRVDMTALEYAYLSKDQETIDALSSPEKYHAKSE